MADLRICAIPQCGKPIEARGWCNKHYIRWRKFGDPLAGQNLTTERGAALNFFRDVVLKYEGDDCLIWPFNRTVKGYGRLGPGIVSRMVCEAANGPPPKPRHDAAHSCGRGNEGCCTKRHLSWKTRAENALDRRRHGTANSGERNGQAKLTEAQVREIHMLKNRMSQVAIGKLYGVSASAIGAILRLERWPACASN